MAKIRFIKTLPHLHNLFLSKTDDVAYLSNFSFQGLQWLNSLELFTKNIKFIQILDSLIQFGFEKVEKVSSPAEFSQRGDIVSLWPVGYAHPIRISFFGENTEEIYFYDEIFGRKIEIIDRFYIGRVSKEMIHLDCNILFLSNTHKIGKTIDNNISRIIFLKSFQGLFSILQISADDVISASEKGFFDKVNELFELGDFEFLNTDFTFPQLFFGQEELFQREIKRLRVSGYKVFLSQDLESSLTTLPPFLQNRESTLVFNSQLQDTNIIGHIPKTLTAGFVSENLKLAYFTDRELNGTIYLGRAERVKKNSNNIEKLLKQFEGNIKVGDFVVHEDYGVSIFKGLKQESVDGEMLEYIELEFERSDQLFVPILQVEKITKFIGPEGGRIKLSKLGGVSWQNIKRKITKSTGILAKNLLEHYAKLAVSETQPLETSDSEDYEKFTSEFTYKPTADQLTSTNEIIADLAKPTPMNRLLVGDVGFGKTEVIMRACFKVVENGGQVLMLSPTTILTQQHFEVFSKRFQNFPISIGFVSRFKSAKENSAEIERFNEGKIDILIGTHRLLSNDVIPRRLKLVVVDEEQRFGVKQKEKLRQLNYSAHMLSVSATPIPRTLGMALSALQDLSVISTPPYERKPVKTEIIKDNWNKVIEAIQFEVDRGGQVFFLHNEVHSIKAIYEKLKAFLPDFRFVIAHGQMSNNELDRSVAEFYNKKYDILIATTIIENGLDMPNVNTIIIHNAHKFGIAQLYQLRGRVGRSDRQAFCYLMYRGADFKKNDLPSEMSIQKFKQIKKRSNLNLQLSESIIASDQMLTKSVSSQQVSEKSYLQRLQAIVENQDLGAGFRVASRDLEIRGAGNLLGEQQSGFISTVGYALYLQLLGQEVEKLKRKEFD